MVGGLQTVAREGSLEPFAKIVPYRVIRCQKCELGSRKPLGNCGKYLVILRKVLESRLAAQIDRAATLQAEILALEAKERAPDDRLVKATADPGQANELLGIVVLPVLRLRQHARKKIVDGGRSGSDGSGPRHALNG